MTRYRLDVLKGRVIAFQCKNAEDYDDANAKQYGNTHFDTHAKALESLRESLRYQVANALVRYNDFSKQRRKARRDLARTIALWRQAGGVS